MTSTIPSEPKWSCVPASGNQINTCAITPDESAGHVYLFDTAAGSIVWFRKTGTMNWPMAISGDGRAIVGGSGDGRLFYWAKTDRRGEAARES
ncbi:MAG: hypothetical protein WD397_08805 [Wenzhouxiangellaceae bacterium]